MEKYYTRIYNTTRIYALNAFVMAIWRISLP